LFSERQIIYFSPFYFKNGNTAKNKFFIVLKNINNITIIASLPTRTNKIPSFIKQAHGCINDDDRCFNCYFFEADRPVCENGFCFPLPTFIYGNEVEDYEVRILKSVYPIEGVDYTIAGSLLKSEYDALINCLKTSKSVYRKIKRML
jgi:hypothetical protein